MLLDQSELSTRVKSLVHESTQLHDYQIHLTVSEIERIDPNDRGQLDFGGNERKQSSRHLVDTQKRNEDDKYGWWELDQGQYIVTFNEQIELQQDELGIVTPLPFLLRNGSEHPAAIVQVGQQPTVMLSAGTRGVSIKENARISALRVWR